MIDNDIFFGRKKSGYLLQILGEMLTTLPTALGGKNTSYQ